MEEFVHVHTPPVRQGFCPRDAGELDACRMTAIFTRSEKFGRVFIFTNKTKRSAFPQSAFRAVLSQKSCQWL